VHAVLLALLRSVGAANLFLVALDDERRASAITI
jgi:hypothetical protein